MNEWDGGPAFPINDASHNNSTCETVSHQHYSVGMSLRDYFAATRQLEEDAADFATEIKEAVVGRPCPKWPSRDHHDQWIEIARWNAEWRAKWAYMQADAMLKARSGNS